MATLKNTTLSIASAVVTPNNTTSTAIGTGKLRYNTTNSQNTLEFYDGTAWRPVTGYSQGLVGTGGNTISYAHGSIVHQFTALGAHTFTPAHSGTVQVLVVGAGGASGYDWAGGGGGGGVIFDRAFPVTSGTGYSITVGDGSKQYDGGGSPSGPTVSAANGGNSVFSTITASGGGGGGSWQSSAPSSMDNGRTGGRTGASGGGGSNTGDGVDSRQRNYGGRGIDGQGYPGGSGIRFNVDIENTHTGGGGGGAGGPGASSPDGRQRYRSSFRGDQIAGGPGRATDILGGSSTLYFGGGGAGGGHLGWNVNGSQGGIGGGGGGSFHHSGPYGGDRKFGQGGGQSLNNGEDGFATARGGHGGANTGGGGGGGQHGRNGGSGVVIVKY